LLLNGFQVLVVVFWTMASLFGSVEDVVENMISNLMWVTWNFINPVIYISFNRALRKHVVDYYRDVLRKQRLSSSAGWCEALFRSFWSYFRILLQLSLLER
uniref:G-protein coupled receptors family 1 profile domain-containing protein n=1 Tax=Parascaris univalens TaxID=6257 RepID=A0A915BYY4_PARUN